LKYAEEKHRLMSLYKDQRPKYVEGKGPTVWSILQRAHRWSQEIGWQPEKSDA
ncbi:GrpB family protein, partial [Clostridioides difficile]